MDCTKIWGARIFVANLNGPMVEDGTAYECAKASTSQQMRQEGMLPQGIEVMLGYFNDDRRLTHNMRRNPMPLAPFLREPNIILPSRKKIVAYAAANFPPRGK